LVTSPSKHRIVAERVPARSRVGGLLGSWPVAALKITEKTYIYMSLRRVSGRDDTVMVPDEAEEISGEIAISGPK